MLKTTTAFIAFTLLLTPLSASARQWVELGEPTYPRVFVDIDSIKGQGDTRKFWERLVMEEDEYTSGLRYRSILSFRYVDCTRNQYGTLHSVLYNAKGSVVGEEDNSYIDVPAQMRSPLPDSVAEITLNYVCNLRRNTSSIARPATETFPRQTCGDTFQPNATLFPVFIERGDIRVIRSRLCHDAFATHRAKTGVPAVQVASFTSLSRAQAFAQQVGGSVGEPTYYVNGEPL